MISQFLSRLFYGSLVMLGVVVIVFFLFQGFGDPARLILGQRADAGTLNNIRKDLYLDQPKWKQFVFYLNDVSPVSIYEEEELNEKNIHGIGIGRKTRLVLKFPYLRRSYQTRKDQFGPCSWKRYPEPLSWLSWLCLLPRSGHGPGNTGCHKKRYLDGHDGNFYQCARNICSFFFYEYCDCLYFWICTQPVYRTANDGQLCLILIPLTADNGNFGMQYYPPSHWVSGPWPSLRN